MDFGSWIACLIDRIRQSRAAPSRPTPSLRKSCSRASGELLETRILPAITFTFDYSLDTSNFFDPTIHADRRLALEQAGQHLGDELDDILTEVIPQKFSVSDTWDLTFDDPSAGGSVTFTDQILGENEIRVYVGAQSLGGALAEADVGVISSLTGVQEWIDNVRSRGQVGALEPVGQESDLGPLGGSISFDTSVAWHFGATEIGLDPGEFDFFSAAVHELTHIAGFGQSAPWMNLSSGLSFTGSSSIAEYEGSGNPPLDDPAHWESGLISNGSEVAMDPDQADGVRKELTPLDFAALRDIGWEVDSGAGGGGGGPFPLIINLADGSAHTLVIEDNLFAGDGMSQYSIDGGTPVMFLSTDQDILVNGGDMADTITIELLDPLFTSEIVLNAGDGDDSLTVDHNAADVVTYNGQIGNDSLAVDGSAATEVAHSFTNSSDGSVMVADASSSLISYTGLEPISDTVIAQTRIFTFAGTADVITLLDDGVASNGVSRIESVSSSESVDFANPIGGVTIFAGGGDDSVSIQSLDAMFAAQVNVESEDGNDIVDASTSTVSVSVNGGAGNDVLIGSSLEDFLLGSGGNDAVTGGGGNDTLLGGGGRDSLNGEAGDDSLRGQGGGADELNGGDGNDTLDGGNGNDILVASGDVNFTLTATTLTGTGSNTIASIERAFIIGGATANVIDLGAFGGIATVFGGAGNDTITGTSGDDQLHGEGDDDEILAGSGNDEVFAGDGNDSVQSGIGEDFVEGGAGSDTIVGDAGHDTLVGNAGNDDIAGGAGNDSLLGGAGADLLNGEADNDVVKGQGTFDSLTGGAGDDTLDGGGGFDRVIEFQDADLTLTDLALNGIGSDALISIEGAELTTGVLANRVDTSGFSGSTIVLLGGGNDTFIGGSGDDFVVGNSGNDILSGNDGEDHLAGGSGRDTLDGGNGNDNLLGLGGSGDSLLGGDGDDLLDGGAGGDRLFGENGDDTLLGGGGQDRLAGNNGNDSLRGGDGDDTLNGNANDDTLIGDAGNDRLDGADGNDGLDGVTGDDILLGAAGNDSLFGGDGNDTLLGGDGADTAIGLADDDSVQGDGGVDALLAGGSGAGADAGDVVVGDPAEINELFSLTPPAWLVSTI